MADYRVTVWVGLSQDIYNTSKIYTALSCLAQDGIIKLRYFMGSPVVNRKRLQEDSLTVNLQVTEARTRRTRQIAIDVYDRSDHCATDILDACDFYFKRGWYKPDVQRLPENLRWKVLPFGLNYPAREPWSASQLLPRYALAAARRLLRNAEGSDLKHWLKRTIRAYLTAPHYRDYERSPDFPTEAVVLFQTRLWDPSDVVPDDPEEVNGVRVLLVRALRKEFGDRFRGGLVPTPYSQKHFPELVVRDHFRRSDYVAMSCSCRIGVYSRGLHHSNAFKLGEYLAASQCIVADTPRQELSASLLPELNFLPFRTADECVQRCTELLESPTAASEMRARNHAYYMRYVHPGQQLLRCFEAAFGRPGESNAIGLGRENSSV